MNGIIPNEKSPNAANFETFTGSEVGPATTIDVIMNNPIAMNPEIFFSKILFTTIILVVNAETRLLSGAGFRF